MPLNRCFTNTAAPGPRRTRPVGPSCRGGASSLLRLAQPAAPRLPHTRILSDWMDRTANALMPVTGPLAGLPSRAALAR